MDPPYLQALKGEYGMMKFEWFRNYHAKYMVQARFKPAIHVITFFMCLGYLMEYPHLKRARAPARLSAPRGVRRARASSDPRTSRAARPEPRRASSTRVLSPTNLPPPYSSLVHACADEKHAAKRKAALAAIEKGESGGHH